MSKELQIAEKCPLVEFENAQKLTKMLLQTKHYSKMGEEGIFAIVQKAKSIGMDPLDALNGAMYFTNGRVELSANAMNYLIRAAGHSITKDAKSTHEVCILHGKRKDNGDTWTASFSITEAKKAGIFRNVWEKYTDDMLFARALTRLARQLFPDVIKGCYVEGEVNMAIPSGDVETIDASVSYEMPISKAEVKDTVLTRMQLNELIEELKGCPQEYQEEFLKKANETFQGIANIPQSKFHATIKRIKQNKVPPEEYNVPTDEDLEQIA